MGIFTASSLQLLDSRLARQVDETRAMLEHLEESFTDSDLIEVDTNKLRDPITSLKEREEAAAVRLGETRDALCAASASWSELEELLAVLQREVLARRTGLDIVRAKKTVVDERIIKKDLQEVEVRQRI